LKQKNNQKKMEVKN